MWQKFNNNPCNRNVGDCAVRAISVALGIDWETAFVTLAYNALQMCDMPSSDSVWGAVLRQSGFSFATIEEDTHGTRYESETEFGRIVTGKDEDAVFAVFDELLSTLQGMIPRLYAGVIGKLQDID